LRGVTQEARKFMGLRRKPNASTSLQISLHTTPTHDSKEPSGKS